MLELAKCQFGLISKLGRSVRVCVCVWGGGVGSRLSTAEKEVLLIFCILCTRNTVLVVFIRFLGCIIFWGKCETSLSRLSSYIYQIVGQFRPVFR